MFIGCIAIWGTTWIAITFQLGDTAPELSVALRFGLASLLLAGYCRRRGEALRQPWRIQARAAGMGLAMFTAGYLCVYYAEQRVVSGLVALGYCATPLVNQWLYRLTLGRPVSARVTVGGLFGLAGIAAIYLPELSKLSISHNVAVGALLTAGAVIFSSTGNVASSLLERDGLSVWQRMTLSMAWGAAGCLLLGLLRGIPLSLHADPAFILSLLYLAIFGSIVAFAMYLTLLETIGGGRAGYIGVMVPIVALALSWQFEGYLWTPLAIAGVALAVAGNLIALSPGQ